MNTVANAGHTAAYKIFHYIFICKTKAANLISQLELETYGHVVTGDRDYDRAMAREEVDAQLTIAHMAEILDDGGDFTLTDPAKSAVIYQIIKEHLEDWEREVNLSLNLVNPPVEDLRKLEVLMQKMALTARYYIKVAPNMSSFFEKLQAMGGRRPSFERSLKREAAEGGITLPDQVPQEVVGGDTAMSDAIARYSGSFKPWQ